MKPWEIYTWNFPKIGPHPAVVLSTEERARHKPSVNVLLCSTQRAARAPQLHEVMLNGADGLDWETLCKCDILYAVEKVELMHCCGVVSMARRRAISERVIRSLGLAGI